MQLTDRGEVPLTHAMLYPDLRRTQIAFATLFGLIFHTVPPPLSILGTAIIVGSALYVAVRLLFTTLVDDD